MTEGLARQLSVILPALGIAVSVQIQAVHGQVKAKRQEAAKAIKAAKCTGKKFADDSPESEIIRQNHNDRIIWGVVGTVAYLYAGVVVFGEVTCLRWLGNDLAWASEGTAIFLISLAIVGLFAVLLIPAARLLESVWRGHMRANRDTRAYDALEPHSEPAESQSPETSTELQQR